MEEIMIRTSGHKKISKVLEALTFVGLIVLIVLSVWAIVVMACEKVKAETKAELAEQYEAQYVEQLAQERINIEQELKEEYGFDKVDEQRSVIETEAMEIAKVLYPMQHNSENGLKSAVWCVINRVESSIYPNTIEEVCSQNAQWMGWSEDNPVIDNLYNIALEQLEIWHNGSTRPMDASYLFLDWNSTEITLRTTFEEKRGTHYWYEEDWND